MTEEPIKKLPSEWEVIEKITIYDPDGWDRKNFHEDWAIPLTREEFLEKAWMSTIGPAVIDRGDGTFNVNQLGMKKKDQIKPKRRKNVTDS